MPPLQPRPLTCLITDGETSRATSPSSPEFRSVLGLVKRTVAARVSVVQLREKGLPARTLYELAARAAHTAAGSATLVVVNDRADVARAAGCDGVHLTTRSLEPRAVRRAFGPDFLVGVSAHSPEEARAASEGGADFAVFGPVYDTPSKRAYGPALGAGRLAEAARALAPFPLVAVGGITPDKFPEVFGAGASGVAAIRMFAEAGDLAALVSAVRGSAAEAWRRR